MEYLLNLFKIVRGDPEVKVLEAWATVIMPSLLRRTIGPDNIRSSEIEGNMNPL
jgi:hypothetical protein